MTLPGCLPVERFDGPAAISLGAGEMQIGICQDIDVNESFGSVRSRGEQWEGFLDAKGFASLRAGQTFELSSIPDGLDVAQMDEPELLAGVEISLTFLTDDEKGTDIRADFRMPEDLTTLQAGGWLHPDGSISTAPCEESR